MKYLLLLLTLGLTGCLLTVNSRQPFYTDATRVSLPALVGGWTDCATLTNRSNPPAETDIGWITRGKTPLQLRITGGSNDVYTWVFFKAGDNLYCDWLADDAQDPYHNLYRANLTGTQLQLAQLDGDWLTNAIARGQVRLPAPERTVNSNWVFNATSLQWLSFLENLGTNTAAFSKEKTCLTRRYNFAPASR